VSIHFSSATDNWATPRAFFDELDREFKFTCDVCATAENAKCARYYSPAEDGLRQEWRGVLWMNPPYGRDIKRWVAKAYVTALFGRGTVVCLVPARTDTAWWHDYCAKGEIRFVRGRLKFGDNGKDAPFPSAIVIFHQRGNSDRIDAIERDLENAA
jgi:phage N-6-adenine-methyltransferase